MKKNIITLDAIKKDLVKIANDQMSNKDDWRLSYIIPITLLAILIGVFFKNIFIGVVIFSLAAYHIVFYILEYKEYKAKKRAVLSLIERSEISISTETLSHITDDVIYEPHRFGRKTRPLKTITLYCFIGGFFWRVPIVYKHYEWSQDFYISTKGLENISIAGDEFFVVSLQEHHDIAYIYPCKFFVLDEKLRENN